MDHARTCSFCRSKFPPVLGHDLGPEGWICSRCYEGGAADPLPSKLEAASRSRRNACLAVVLAVVVFWIAVALGLWAALRAPASSSSAATEVEGR